MNWEALGAVGETIGAVAVIASLIYLATQIRTSSSIAKAENQRELLNLYNFYSPTALNSDLADIARAGLTDFNALSDTEKFRFASWLNPLANQIEAVFYMYRQGLIEENSYQGFRGAFLSIVACEGGAAWWEQTQGSIGQEFVAEINTAMKVEDVVPLTTIVPYYRSSPSESQGVAT